MTEEVATRLLEAIAANKLLVLAGAGLSMAAPSNLPSAAAVAQRCANTYAADTGAALPPEIRADVARMAEYFTGLGRFENFFIATLVPWPELNGPPNRGHDALADLLACGVLVGASTTNFDDLVESAASGLREPDFRAVVDAGDLGQHTPHRPYIKLHGCAVRSRQTTIWCREQLADPSIRRRINQFRAWLAANLGGRDLIFVGFWSDWAYLTELLAEYLAATAPQHVYLVDPENPDQLQIKAPDLWAWAHGPGVRFHHCQESGCDFLDELRRRWSRVFVRRLMDESIPTYRALFGAPAAAAPGAGAETSEDLYALRRDLTGTPRNSVVRDREPDASDHIAGAIHRRLLERGAAYLEHCYRFNGRSIRLVSGKGRVLSLVRASFQNEPPLHIAPDAVVCAGSLADPSPPHLIRAGGRATIVRPGEPAAWATHESLVKELQV
jgi:hypothetical protein